MKDDKILYEGIMYGILKKYKLYNRRDDYIDLCYIGYTKALKSFDESKGTLKSYIYNCVENEILGELRKQNAQKRQRVECSVDTETDNLGHTYVDLIPCDVDLEQDIIKQETSQELRMAIEKLTKQEQLIIINLFELCENPLSANKLCRKLAITSNELEDIKLNALDKLKDMLGDIK